MGFELVPNRWTRHAECEWSSQQRVELFAQSELSAFEFNLLNA